MGIGITEIGWLIWGAHLALLLAGSPIVFMVITSVRIPSRRNKWIAAGLLWMIPMLALDRYMDHWMAKNCSAGMIFDCASPT